MQAVASRNVTTVLMGEMALISSIPCQLPTSVTARASPKESVLA